MPSIENLLNFCDYFGITISEFFDEQSNYPVEYKAIIQELNKLDSMELNTVMELLKIINANKK